ncbi:MAG: hypothetical protein DMG57_32945 [Acidobacteria bacterium]|nr:MAG: hypothetical protein DMG57_32945 [Acidobacteriota bacterium]
MPPQYEQQFLSPVPLQALGNILRRGLHPGLDQGGQYPGITLSFQDGANDLHATHTAEVAQHVAELHIHLRQDFLHALNSTAGFGHQIAPLPPQGARNPDLIGRLEAVIQQSKGV